jgi:cytochrome oxidase Cu insertion factor (SCO1/SenC/PrrC family)
MKVLKFFITMTLFLLAVACNGQTQQAKPTATSDKIEVYYFHFTARCLTCNTVESETKKNIEILYPELVKAGKISFKSLNVDEKSTTTIAKKLKVYGQTLLVVKQNRKIDLTNDAFLYARSNPEKYKAIMKNKIEELK